MSNHRGRIARAGAAVTVVSVVTFGLSGLAFAVPATSPTVLTPTAGAVVSGAVAVSASSTQPSVQFVLDGVALGAPIATVAGTATTTWSTYGLLNESTHTIAAADCDQTGCAAPGASTTVTVHNSAPTVSSPTPGSVVGAATTLTANANGGGLKFFVDFAAVGFDASAPYSVAVSGLTEGAHSVAVVPCDATGNACAGPATLVQFTVQVLHPVISSLAPTGLSPNGDGRFDTTQVTYSLPESEAVSYSVVLKSTSALVRGPVSLGVAGAGSHSFVWNGSDNTGHRVGDGIYTIRLDTYRHLAGSEIARGAVSRDVRVDTGAPSLAALVGSGATFYPYPDTYGDTWQPHVTVGESAKVYLEVLNSHGAVLRRVSTYRSGAGVATLAWNGRTASGVIVSAGTYAFRIWAEDLAGNRRVSANYTVKVSAKRLISKSATVRVNGYTGVPKSTDWSCTGASTELSYFTKGMFLVNDCPDPQLILADYLVTLPAATRYNTIAISSYGNTDLAPEHINGAWWNYAGSTWTIGSFISLTQNHHDGWSSLGSVSASGRVSNGHAHVAVAVTNVETPSDYDIGLVQVTVHYQVLG